MPAEVYPPNAERVLWARHPRRRYWLHLLLFAVTFFTTLVVGARLQWNFDHGYPAFMLDESIFPAVWAVRGHYLLQGLPFSLTLMLILLAHEMGHFLYCVKYRVAATLPYFIPFPSLIGTLGAFIRIRSPLRSRSVLFDIGIAGPIAGFAVALPVLLWSLGRSHAAPFGVAIPRIELGIPLVFYLARKVLVATGLGAAIAGVPLSRLYLHPVAIAAWVGMFATSLNLLPGGQLDGGHILYAISSRAHRRISRATVLVLIPMAVFLWTGWLVWAVMLRVSGTRHPMVAEWPDIGSKRRWFALVAPLLLVLTFSFVPVSTATESNSLLDLFGYVAGGLRHWLGAH
ncbi:MAG TPA: site-2 protease family protein [Candidatus Sulfotelmatobacter sp.]|nr:site-2 protease family protein [Candidatus Sulfotelmatobacter sp.]